MNRCRNIFRAGNRVAHACCGSRLLFDCGSDCCLVVVDSADDISDVADGVDGCVATGSDRLNKLSNVVGGFGRFFCKVFDFIRDDREALTRFARPGRLDCCVEGEKVGLFGDC